MAHALLRAASALVPTLAESRSVSRECVCATCILLVLPLAAQTLDECRGLRHHGKLAEAQTCYAKLATASNPICAPKDFGASNATTKPTTQFREVIKQNPKNADYRVRWGLLFFERFNNDEAQGLFEEALKIDRRRTRKPTSALREVEAEGFSQDAVKAAQKAADLDPKLYEAHEQLAFLALEDNDEDTAAKQADLALGISGEALDAMAIHLSIDFLHDKNDTPWAGRILKVNPAYGEAYSTAGHFYVINRRYDQRASPPIAGRSN